MDLLAIEPRGKSDVFEPLDVVGLTCSKTDGCTVSVRDGLGRIYLRQPAQARMGFLAGGALGTHLVVLEDPNGRELASARFRVDCRTEIDDRGGRFNELLRMLHYTMLKWGEGGNETSCAIYKGRIYKFFVRWLRDHVHTLKGMKYFYPDLKSAIELYRDSQRSDGMIWDNIYDRTPEPNYWDQLFGPGNFVMPIENGTAEFKRIPVENDVEYLFVEGLYYTWKACGDDAWMASCLDSAIKAFKYATSSPYRWSRKYKLLKRGFTIDTWDFQAEEDAAATGHAMVVHPKKTRFGIMHGDNTGFAASCIYLAEMLERVGRSREALRYRKLAEQVRRNLDRIAWNGRFYTHHVSEDPRVVRELGVDLSRQISLSNTYALNRGIPHEKCVAIIREYQRIKADLPEGSPGEWYSIYPPFPKGFDAHAPMWEYMNGGVLSIAAGELAHGAFEHGFEEYGADILLRIRELAKKHGGYLHCCFRGSIPRPPKRSFETIDISGQANVDFSGKGAPGVQGWTGQGDNDLREMPVGLRTFAGVPFLVTDPAKNGRKACIGLADRPGYKTRAVLPIWRKAASVYLLHTSAAGGGLAGWVTLEYRDGTSTVRYVHVGSEVVNWWMPELPKTTSGRPRLALAWQGKNPTCARVGVVAWGFDNPYPDKEIARIVLEASRGGPFWFVLGVTLSAAPAYFPPGDVSYGIPDNWGAAAVVYALIEGLAGIKDIGVAFDKALVAPRWQAAGVDEVTATAKYEASGGYVRYRYTRNSKAIEMTLTGSMERSAVEVLLPPGRTPSAVELDGAPVEFSIRKVERSRYAVFEVSGVGVHKVRLLFGRR